MPCHVLPAPQFIDHAFLAAVTSAGLIICRTCLKPIGGTSQLYISCRGPDEPLQLHKAHDLARVDAIAASCLSQRGTAAGDQTSRSTSAVRKSWHVQMPPLLIGKPALMTTPTGVKTVAAAHRAAAAEVAEKRTAAAAAASSAATGKKPVAATTEGPANPAKQGGGSQLALQQKGPVGVAATQKEPQRGARAAHAPAGAGVDASARSADVDVPPGATEGGSTAAAAGATAAYQQQLMAQPLTAQGKREGLRDATNQQHHAQPAGLCAPAACHYQPCPFHQS